MYNIKIFSPWELAIDLQYEKQVELYVDIIPNTPKQKDVIRFLFMLEPPTFLNLTKPVLNNQHLFDYIFTHNEDVLNNCNKAILFEHGTCGNCWINEYNDIKKEYNISTVVGFKTISDGHFLRHSIWNEQDKITTPKKFFLSKDHQGLNNINNNPVLGNSKLPLFNSQFHICIESTKRNNYFTEKLIDCLITKTIPIYYGCPTIEKWFNMKGFFIVNNTTDIINVCNSLNENTYNEMLSFIEENYEKAKEFVDISDRLKKTIQKFLNNE